jgi:iron complex transport system ATP-binding protein
VAELEADIMSAALLEVENLSYGFRGKRIGEAFTFSLRENEVMAVLGPNGAGKTTLFRTLLGLLPPHAGSIKLSGKSLDDYDRATLARTMTYVPQAHDSYFPFQVRDVVLMGRTAHLGLFASPGKRDRELADGAMRQLRIDHLADRPFDEISGGEQQLALIARAMATEARFFVMDEPTANLDYGNQLLILDEIARLRESGKTILFCTHHPEQAARCADTVLMTRDGKVLALGPAQGLITLDNVKTLYRLPAEYAAAPYPTLS